MGCNNAGFSTLWIAQETDLVWPCVLVVPSPDMLSRTFVQAGKRAAAASRASSTTSSVGAVRHASNLPIPPKIATPKSVQGPAGGDSSRMESVVAFYKSLPKGAAPKRSGGIKGR